MPAQSVPIYLAVTKPGPVPVLLLRSRAYWGAAFSIALSPSCVRERSTRRPSGGGLLDGARIRDVARSLTQSAQE